MKIITELELRELYKQAEFTTYQLEPGTRLTPAAAQFLTDRRIALTDEAQPEQSSSRRTLPEVDDGKGYTLVTSGEKVGEKGECLTHLRGTNLVPKNHPRIKFRGKLDSLQAQLISTIVEIEGSGHRELAKDLSEVLDYARQIMSAEVLDKPLVPLAFHGLTQLEIQERSHHPDKYFGIGHIFVQPAHGKLLASLNLIRTECRELELAGIDAFYQGEVEPRMDIIQSLNRLSSLIYVMMLQLSSGHYRLG